MEKHQPRRRDGINLPVASKLHFLDKKILYFILFGPEGLLELREDVMLAISSLSVKQDNTIKTKNKKTLLLEPKIPYSIVVVYIRLLGQF